jgi:hypothetical protein
MGKVTRGNNIGKDGGTGWEREGTALRGNKGRAISLG